MGDKNVETLCNKIEFLSILVTFPPFPPKQCWFFCFFDCTDHSAYTTLNWGAGGIRELTLEVNEIEQMLKYRKASFPKSVSTAFVAHCCFWKMSALKASKWSQITLCILTNVLTSIHERFCPNFEQITFLRDPLATEDGFQTCLGFRVPLIWHVSSQIGQSAIYIQNLNVHVNWIWTQIWTQIAQGPLQALLFLACPLAIRKQILNP